MSQRTVEQAMLGATLALSATLPATYDAAGYGATSMVYTTIGLISDFGEHGETANVIKFTPVASGVVSKQKGSRDYGAMQVQMAYVPGDAGQTLIATASESQNHYSAKVTYPVGPGEATAEIHYLDVLVTKQSNKDGSVDSVRMLDVTLEVCKKPVVIAAT